MSKMVEREMAGEIEDILKRSYHRVIMPDGDEMFCAYIEEFPGCLAIGKRAAEALANLEEVAKSWLESALEHGQAIPEPGPDEFWPVRRRDAALKEQKEGQDDTKT